MVSVANLTPGLLLLPRDPRVVARGYLLCAPPERNSEFRDRN